MLYDNILVPYDGSESARAALAESLKFVRDDPTLTLHIIQIVDTEQLVINRLEAQGRTRETIESSEEVHALFESVVEEANKKLHEHIDALLKGLMSRIIIEMLEETVPAEQIVTYANEHSCDLIVMGSRGLGALRGMLGSVSSYVLRHAEMPVLIVKQPSED